MVISALSYARDAMQYAEDELIVMPTTCCTLSYNLGNVRLHTE